MNYKRIRIFKLILILCIIQTALVFWGCEKKHEEEKETPTEKFASVAEDGVTAVKAPQGKEIVDGVGCDYDVRESQEYDFETDYNNRIRSANRVTDVKSEILLGDYEILAFNKNLKKGQIFCGRPNCNHISTSCISHSDGMLQYYNGEIYSVDIDKMQLKRKSMDAATVDVVGNLVTVDHIETTNNQNAMTCNWIIHRGYIYYIYFYYAGFDDDGHYLNNSNCIFRKSLEGNDEPECIMPLPMGLDPWDCGLSAADSYIYIKMEKNGADYYTDIYRYNTETDMIENFKDIDESIVGVYCSENGFYYLKNDYKNNEGEKKGEIYFYDNREHKKEKISEIHENILNMLMDGDYMYLYREAENSEKEDADSYMGIYDRSGNKLYEVKLYLNDPKDGEEAYVLKHNIIFLGSDDKYIFFLDETILEDDSYNIWGMPRDFYYQLMVIDKAKLKEGNLEYEIWGK